MFSDVLPGASYATIFGKCHDIRRLAEVLLLLLLIIMIIMMIIMIISINNTCCLRGLDRVLVHVTAVHQQALADLAVVRAALLSINVNIENSIKLM